MKHSFSQEIMNMTTKEAFETVIDAADLFTTLMKEKAARRGQEQQFNHEALTEAINIVEDFKDDMIRS